MYTSMIIFIKLSSDHRCSFHGARVNVTALPYAPFWDEREGPNNTTVYVGTDYNTVMTIGESLNFTIRVVPTSSWAEVRCRHLLTIAQYLE